MYFGGVTSFEAVWKGFGKQDKAVVFGVLVGILVGSSNLSAQKLFLDLFCRVGSGAVDFVVPLLPNSEAEISEVSDEGWSEVCSNRLVSDCNVRRIEEHRICTHNSLPQKLCYKLYSVEEWCAPKSWQEGPTVNGPTCRKIHIEQRRAPRRCSPRSSSI